MSSKHRHWAKISFPFRHKRKIAKSVKHLLRDRSQVERLEERILLSADPLIQESWQPQVDEFAAAERVNLSVDAIQIERDKSAYFTDATVIDLTQGADSDILLSLAAGDAQLLELNTSLDRLVFNLSGEDDNAVLSTEGDMLRLSGDSFNDILFQRPSLSLAIEGLAGDDAIDIKTADLGDADIYIGGESITLGSGESLTTGGDVRLNASDSIFENTMTSSVVNAHAIVNIDGQIIASGAVSLSATIDDKVNLNENIDDQFGANFTPTPEQLSLDSA